MLLNLKPFIDKHLRSRHVVQIAKNDGKFQIDGAGAWYRYLGDPYHLIITVSWPGFAAIVGIGYFILNSIFALLYLVGENNLSHARPGSFTDAFFFSVQTLATIGYGSISPQTTYANIIVAIEALTALLAAAIITGLSFARFTKPTARILFSKVAVIAPHNNLPTLMFRMSNKRLNEILDAQLKVFLLQDSLTSEGRYIYQIQELKLLQERTPTLTLTWTAMHAIDKDSPLYGATWESLANSHTQIVASLSGVDNTVSYLINTQHAYGANQIMFDHYFRDIIYFCPRGNRYFNSAYFHDVIPLETISQSNKQDSGLGLA
ncbi:ATP-sensitive inward rectifier potassium channel 10 [Calothrix sp. HK-06]|nr:ATP-sensitive inward rectifier potassium channel 10 [Calothrix sp. HK-06]